MGSQITSLRLGLEGITRIVSQRLRVESSEKKKGLLSGLVTQPKMAIILALVITKKTTTLKFSRTKRMPRDRS